MRESFEQPASVESAHEIPEWKRAVFATISEIEEGIEDSIKRTGGKNGWVESFLNQLATFELTLDFYHGNGDISPEELIAMKERLKEVTEEAKKYQNEGIEDNDKKTQLLEGLWNVVG